MVQLRHAGCVLSDARIRADATCHFERRPESEPRLGRAASGGLNQPTSLEFIGNTAYVVTLGGEIWKIDGVSSPPYGIAR
jgi:hypothetical protein